MTLGLYLPYLQFYMIQPMNTIAHVRYMLSTAAFKL